jgi:hypothetical protein
MASLPRGTHARCIAFHPEKPLLAVVRAPPGRGGVAAARAARRRAPAAQGHVARCGHTQGRPWRIVCPTSGIQPPGRRAGGRGVRPGPPPSRRLDWHLRALPRAHAPSPQGVATSIGGYDLLTGCRMGRVDVHSPPVGMAFSRDGTLLVVATQARL